MVVVATTMGMMTATMTMMIIMLPVMTVISMSTTFHWCPIDQGPPMLQQVLPKEPPRASWPPSLATASPPMPGPEARSAPFAPSSLGCQGSSKASRATTGSIRKSMMFPIFGTKKSQLRRANTETPFPAMPCQDEPRRPAIDRCAPMALCKSMRPTSNQDPLTYMLGHFSKP